MTGRDFENLLAEDGLRFDISGKLVRSKLPKLTAEIKLIETEQEKYARRPDYVLRQKWDEAERNAKEVMGREEERRMRQAAESLRARDDYLREERLRNYSTFADAMAPDIAKLLNNSRATKPKPDPEPDEPPEPVKPKITTRKLEM